jgi:hypothetical protein
MGKTIFKGENLSSGIGIAFPDSIFFIYQDTNFVIKECEIFSQDHYVRQTDSTNLCLVKFAQGL